MAASDINKEIRALKRKIKVSQNAQEAMESQAELQALYAEKHAEYLREQVDAEKERIKYLLERNELTQKEAEGLLELQEARERGLELGEKEIRQAEQRKKAAKDFADKLGDELSGLLGISRQWEEGIVGSFIKARKAGASFIDILKQTDRSLRRVLNPLNLAGSLISKFVESTIAGVAALDTSNSVFLRATGATNNYATVIQDAWIETRAFGVRTSEAGAALASLYNNMVDFTRLSPEMRTSLVETVSLMAEAGVSTQTSSQALDVFTRVMGLSARQATTATRELFQVARNIGLSVETVISDFAQASSQLAIFGDDMLGVFEGLEAQSKATGISLQGLLGIVSQYDTFESATDAAGALNALLGGPFLNSIELLGASYEDRIELLRESLQLSGKEWATMNRFERQAVASAARITDMSEAARIFGYESEAFDEAATGVGNAQTELEALNQVAVSTQSIVDVLASLMDSFALAIPQEQITAFKGVITDFATGITQFVTSGAMRGFIDSVMESAGAIFQLAKYLLLFYGVVRPMMSLGGAIGGAIGLVVGGPPGAVLGSAIGTSFAFGAAIPLAADFSSRLDSALGSANSNLQGSAGRLGAERARPAQGLNQYQRQTTPGTRQPVVMQLDGNVVGQFMMDELNSVGGRTNTALNVGYG